MQRKMSKPVVMTTLSHHPFHSRIETRPQWEPELHEKMKGKHPEHGRVSQLLGQLYLQHSWLRKRQCCGSPGGCHVCSQVTWSEALIHLSVRSYQPATCSKHSVPHYFMFQNSCTVLDFLKSTQGSNLHIQGEKYTHNMPNIQLNVSFSPWPTTFGSHQQVSGRILLGYVTIHLGRISRVQINVCVSWHRPDF